MSKALDQKKHEYLSSLLSAAKSEKLNNFDFPDTPDVLAARKILNSHSVKRNKALARLRLAVNTAAEKIREHILFSDNEKALLEIRKFEKRIFK